MNGLRCLIKKQSGRVAEAVGPKTVIFVDLLACLEKGRGMTRNRSRRNSGKSFVAIRCGAVWLKEARLHAARSALRKMRPALRILRRIA